MGQLGRNKKNIVMITIVSVFFVLCELFFFRNIIGNGNMLGDKGDGRLTNLLTEHWWKFLCGKEAFSELAFFYPKEDVMGYTDMFLGYGIIYSAFRLIGMNVFMAYKCTLIGVHLIGTISMFYLLKKKLHVDYMWSAFGTLAFSYSASYARHMMHTQLIVISTLPILLILFVSIIDNFYNRIKRNIFVYLFILWFAMMAYTSWYVAYFTGLFCLITLVVYGFILVKNRISVWNDLKEKIAYLGIDLLGYAIYLVIVFIPFLKIYLPVMQNTGGYHYSNVSIYLPEIIDLINVTETNFLMGRVMSVMNLSERGYSGEVTQGFSVVLLILFFLCLWRLQKKQTDKTNYEKKFIDKYLNKLVYSLFISVVISIVLMIRLGSNGVSLWIFVYYLIPGAKSIRAVARFLLWLSFPISVLTALMGKCLCENIKNKHHNMLISFVLLLLFISNIDKVGVNSNWSIDSELEFITSVAFPPDETEVFYIIDTSNAGEPNYIYQLDAFEIASWYSLKTINGYSGQFPSNWGGIWEVCSDSYESSVYQWISENNLENVYAYDKATNTWIPFEERMQYIVLTG